MCYLCAMLNLYIHCVLYRIIMNANDSLKTNRVPPVAVVFSVEDYATLQEIASVERASLAGVVRRFVGQGLDKHRECA